MKKKTTVNYPVELGDAIILIKEDGRVELCFGEDDKGLKSPMVWPDQENYKTAVQFALMLDSYIKNGDALDEIIITSPTGNLPNDLLQDTSIGSVEISGFGNATITGVDEVVESLPEEEREEKDSKSNILDLTKKLKSKDDNEN